ncbi:39K [Mocis latipes granulovirus]|uniref:39K n=1 Tax=Mocis latipes granulovirus TaxID=2072024 RepID=A0A161CD68_9BBAC|nr:39K [Mocis latipes granulovirus]AKR17501.1 39K [Mocis latipes granulovirus]
MQFVNTAPTISNMPREVASSTESLAESAPAAPRNYFVNIEKFTNSAEIVDMLESNSLHPLFNNKHLDVKLKVEINPLKKSNLKKKKPLLYSNNKYILFTQLISRLKLEWKSSNKMWSLMGINPETNEPYDENGHPLYQILEKIEHYHKDINEYDTITQKEEHGAELSKTVKNIERTDKARKHAVEYSLALLVAFYEGSHVPHPDPNNIDAVKIFKHSDSFKYAMDRFKVFVEQHRAVNNASDSAVSKPAAAGKVKKTATKSKTKKTLSAQMVSDALEQPQYTFTLQP